MNAFQRLVGVVVGVFTLAVTSEAKEKWIHARTEHFEMYSAASEKDSRQFLNKLEQFHSAFHQLFKLQPMSGNPATIIMVKSNKQIQSFMPAIKGSTKKIGGFYLPSPDEDFIVVSAEAQESMGQTANVILHEYVHRLLNEQGYQLPLCLDEGLACFFLNDGGA